MIFMRYWGAFGGASSKLAILTQRRCVAASGRTSRGRPGGWPLQFILKEPGLKVLKLSAQGLPQSWISLEEAVLHYAADEVRWEMGAEVAVFHGGHNAITGRQSIITVNSIIGTQGVPRINPFDPAPHAHQQQAVFA